MEFTMALSLYSKKVLDDPIDEAKSISREEGVTDNKRVEAQDEIHSSDKEF